MSDSKRHSPFPISTVPFIANLTLPTGETLAYPVQGVSVIRNAEHHLEVDVQEMDAEVFMTFERTSVLLTGLRLHSTRRGVNPEDLIFDAPLPRLLGKVTSFAPLGERVRLRIRQVYPWFTSSRPHHFDPNGMCARCGVTTRALDLFPACYGKVKHQEVTVNVSGNAHSHASEDMLRILDQLVKRMRAGDVTAYPARPSKDIPEWLLDAPLGSLGNHVTDDIFKPALDALARAPKGEYHLRLRMSGRGGPFARIPAWDSWIAGLSFAGASTLKDVDTALQDALNDVLNKISSYTEWYALPTKRSEYESVLRRSTLTALVALPLLKPGESFHLGGDLSISRNREEDTDDQAPVTTPAPEAVQETPA